MFSSFNILISFEQYLKHSLQTLFSIRFVLLAKVLRSFKILLSNLTTNYVMMPPSFENKAPPVLGSKRGPFIYKL
jgi:hypothetical protein